MHGLQHILCDYMDITEAFMDLKLSVAIAHLSGSKQEEKDDNTIESCDYNRLIYKPPCTFSSSTHIGSLSHV